MHCAAVFLVAAFSVAAQGVPSARTFASSQHHASHQHPAFLGTQHQTIEHGHQVDSFVSALVCQVVKVPAGQSGAQPAIPSHNVPATTAAGSQPVIASSVISSSQDALSNLRSNVRTAVDRLVDPVVAALQNASLWLNRTSQLHLKQSQQHSHHDHLHGGQVNNHAAHEHAPNHQVHFAHGHQTPQAIPNPAVPMTIVSVPVLVPAVHAGSFRLMNQSAVVTAGVASVQFSNPGPENATSSLAVAAESTPATSQPASTPANGDLVGRTGALTTPPGTDAPATLASDIHGSRAVFDISTLSVASRSLGPFARQFLPPVVHHPVCPYDCVPPERRR
ncbi:hypothetical protein HPB49_013014 [Dermacentor silvarum]|uniref:Uncharacterized protein n=1 Tax=Dermacentor silvarum TaxID=543639 RepID=A0ACB8C9H2_DERSI|nr:hypothetical protein HPB49_013014 [Dermacentor silvarum]